MMEESPETIPERSRSSISTIPPSASASQMKQGLPPGTPVYTGDQEHGTSELHLIDYEGSRMEQRDNVSAAMCERYRNAPGVTWINVVGLSDVDVIQDLCRRFEIHPLAIEDIVQPGGRPKLDDYDGFLFLILKTLHFEKRSKEVEVDAEHVSIIIGSDYVLTFQEKEGDPFDPVRTRIQKNIGKIRKLGADFLAYSLVDAIVDSYLVALSELGEEIEDYEDLLMIDTPNDALVRIGELRTAVMTIRHAVRPLRDAIHTLRLIRSPMISKDIEPYLRDVHDHVEKSMEISDKYREMVMNMVALYHTGVSFRLNEIMKVLTIISTIFIPLTFLTSLYGMNFSNIPELKTTYGYYFLLIVMATIAGTLILFFRRKRWL
jgi:magnesium transporter